MYELRRSRGGRVVRVEVDEGQMVAEDDEIVLLESDAGSQMVVTDVPGVVRELYVEAGQTIGAGAVVALIDEA
jgi:multidrug efflux pump subunit AcrA (membrane-fusion protein)